jgi:hypothetical protein
MRKAQELCKRAGLEPDDPVVLPFSALSAPGVQRTHKKQREG